MEEVGLHVYNSRLMFKNLVPCAPSYFRRMPYVCQQHRAAGDKVVEVNRPMECTSIVPYAYEFCVNWRLDWWM